MSVTQTMLRFMTSYTAYRPRYSQDSTIDVKKGRKVASVARIPGAGHQVSNFSRRELRAVLTVI